MKRVLKPVFTIALLTSLVACGPSTRQEPLKEAPGTFSKVKVEVAVPREGQRIYKASGTVRAVTTAPLASRIMGIILEVRVREGDRVKAGQVLVVIDGREADAMVRKSEAGMQEASMALQEIEKGLEAGQANLQLASSTLKRFQELADQKSVSPQEFDEIQTRQRAAAASFEALQAKKRQVLAKIQQAQADVNTSQALQSYTLVRTPMDGVIVERHVEPGSLSVPGTPLLTVEDIGRYQLEVPVEENQVSKVRAGMTVSVKVDPLSAPEMRGKVAEVRPSADPASRTYLVKINLPARAELRSGMYGEAYFPVGSIAGMWLPKKCMIREGQLEGVYVVDKDSVARLRLLKLGEASPEVVEVLAGLDSGESYVVEGMSTVRDGGKVEVAR